MKPEPRIDDDGMGWCSGLDCNLFQKGFRRTVKVGPHVGPSEHLTLSKCAIGRYNPSCDLCLPYARQQADRIKELEAIVDKLPKDDSIRTALAANGSMKDGEIVYDESYCMCDASVGMSPCGYCAIHDALRKTFEAREAAEKAKEQK